MSTQTPTDGDSGTDTDNHLIADDTAPADDAMVTMTMANATLLELTNVLAADARRHDGEGRHDTAEHLYKLREELQAARP